MQDRSSRPIKAVLFDWDETLGPYSLAAGAAALGEALFVPEEVVQTAERLLWGGEQPGLEDLDDPAWKPPPDTWREMTLREVLRRSYQLMGRSWPTDPAAEHALLLRNHLFSLASIGVAEGATEVLDTLRRSGLRLGLVSNVVYLPRMLRAQLDRDRLLPHFDATIFSSELGRRKPHPAIYQAALDALGVEPAETVFIGDRVLEDVAGPRRLGMQAILTRQFRDDATPMTGLARPDAIIHDLRELPALLHAWSAKRASGDEVVG